MRRASRRNFINYRETLFLPDVDIYPVDDEEEVEQMGQDPFPLEVQLDENIAATDDDGYVNSMSNYEYESQPQTVPVTCADSDDDGGIACELCGRRFPNICGLRTHKRSHKDDMINLGQTRYKGSNLNFNPRQSHPEETVDEEIDIGYPCEICKRSFPNIHGLRTHERFFGHASVTASTSLQATTKSISDIKYGSPCKTLKHIKTRRKKVVKTPEPFTEHATIPGQSEVPTRIANTFKGGRDFSDSNVDSINLNVPRVRNSTQIAKKYVLRLNEHSAFNANQIIPDETITIGSDIRLARPSFKQNLMKKNGQPENSMYTKRGIFYECKLCGNRNLHINGFRSHWNRHVRDGDFRVGNKVKA